MNDEIRALTLAMLEAKNALREAQRRAEPEPVKDWVLRDRAGGEVALSSLFGDSDELLVVHNMGKSCSYCTLWADGFRGHADHLASRAPFVLCSHDEPAVLDEFAQSRSWNFPCVSGAGSGFAAAMGFATPDGKPLPGVSAFKKNPDGSIVRTGMSPFGPGDDFCPPFALFDMLAGGVGDWSPKYSYDEKHPSGVADGCGCKSDECPS